MSKVKIYTWADKAPEFLYKQYETLKKFVKDDDWEFIVFNNVPAPKLGRQMKIKKICKELGIKCLDVRFRSFISGASYITGWGIYWAYHRFFRWQKDTIQVVFDSDMFLVADFNFNDYLGDNKIAAILQKRGEIDYLWNGIMIMKGAKLPDKNYFDCRLGTIEGERTDTGGKLYYWLKRNPELPIKYIRHSDNKDISQTNYIPEDLRAEYDSEYNFQVIENSVLHYRAGSNWNKKKQNYIERKQNYLNKFLDEFLQDRAKVQDISEIFVTEEGE